MAMHENRLDVAERLLKPHLKEDPFDVRAIRMLAELAARHRTAEAMRRRLLRRALEIAPGLHRRRGPTSRWCSAGMGRPAEALELARRTFRGRAGATSAIST